VPRLLAEALATSHRHIFPQTTALTASPAAVPSPECRMVHLAKVARLCVQVQNSYSLAIAQPSQALPVHGLPRRYANALFNALFRHRRYMLAHRDAYSILTKLHRVTQYHAVRTPECEVVRSGWHGLVLRCLSRMKLCLGSDSPFREVLVSFPRSPQA
jgi:hypothetical protein